jgi:hypothetical protein
MRFETIRYLDWARRRFDENPPEFNLAASGMEGASMAEAGIDPTALRINGNNAFGHPGLRRRIAAAENVPVEKVLIASGTSQANFLLQAALLQEGDTALCEWPAYEPLWRTLEALGVRIEWFDRDPAQNFRPDLERIAEGFAKGARLCMLSDLHNPSAALLERDVVREIGRLAQRHDAWVLIDEVYLSSVFDQDLPSAVHLNECIVITSSLTKTYGLGGLRAGWALAPAAVVARANDINAHLIGNAPFIADEAACMAFDHLPQLKARARQRRTENWPLVREFAVTRKLLERDPAGAFIAWLKLPGGLEADRFVDHLSAKHGTLVVAGSFFGAPDHIRLGYAQKKSVVEEGLKRIGQALDELA